MNVDHGLAKSHDHRSVLRDKMITGLSHGNESGEINTEVYDGTDNGTGKEAIRMTASES